MSDNNTFSVFTHNGKEWLLAPQRLMSLADDYLVTPAVRHAVANPEHDVVIVTHDVDHAARLQSLLDEPQLTRLRIQTTESARPESRYTRPQQHHFAVLTHQAANAHDGAVLRAVAALVISGGEVVIVDETGKQARVTASRPLADSTQTMMRDFGGF